MNKSKQKELAKTASLHLLLFIMSSMMTQAFFVSSAQATSYDCGDERTGVPFLLAYGKNLETYDIYGVKSKVLVKDPSICGTNKEDGSVVGVLVAVMFPNSDFIETGYFKGNYSSLESLNAVHYFWGKKYDGGSPSYSDISSGTGKSPNINDYIYFETVGNIGTSDHDWHVKIERVSDYTINISGLTMSNEFGTNSRVVLESHNSNSNGSARLKEIVNGKNVSGSLNWVDWLDSEAQQPNNPPYHASKVSQTEYCMYSNSAGCPS